MDEGAKTSDICMVLVPDEKQADLYNDHLSKNLKEGASLLFAHDFQFIFNLLLQDKIWMFL